MAKKKSKENKKKFVEFVKTASHYELTENEGASVELIERLVKEGDRAALAGLASCASAYIVSFFLNDGDALSLAIEKQRINILCSLFDMADYVQKACTAKGCGNCPECQSRAKLLAEIHPIIEEHKKKIREAMN